MDAKMSTSGEDVEVGKGGIQNAGESKGMQRNVEEWDVEEKECGENGCGGKGECGVWRTWKSGMWKTYGEHLQRKLTLPF